MFTKLIGVATLFAAGSLMAGGSPSVGATAVEPFSEELLSAGRKLRIPGAQGGGQGPRQGQGGQGQGWFLREGLLWQQGREEGPRRTASCGSKDAKKGKKEGSCGKDKKEASCGADKK